MELSNEFTVAAPVDQAWAVLTDLERIAPCMPGAQLTEVEGDEYRGNVKVKVGPITAQYKGAASFVSRDDSAHVAVLKAEGRDTRGQGNASATITARLVSEGAGTKVTVDTDLTITGKVAQMGRGVLADVSAKLLGQFVESLERDVLAGAAPPSAAGNGAEAAPTEQHVADAPPMAEPAAEPGGVRKVDSAEARPVDLLDAAGAPVAKRVGPIIGVLVVVLWLLRRRRKRKR
ncbi:MAG TPA: SRPBCC family protein [Acidimicrobiales bacterium]|nr:SRPBCC family protein [Acidimicrobiales bacterium]